MNRLQFVIGRKFIILNLILMLVVKSGFSIGGPNLANLLDGFPLFGKDEVIVETNNFRAQQGLPPLKNNYVLDLAAQQKLEDMLQGQYFAHVSPSGVSPWHWFEVNKYNYRYAGENLAIGFLDAKSTVDAWEQSPSHRANLTNKNYQEIGIAVAPANFGNYKGYLVVQLFGTPQPAVAAQKTFSFSAAQAEEVKVVLAPTPKPRSSVEGEEALKDGNILTSSPKEPAPFSKLIPFLDKNDETIKVNPEVTGLGRFASVANSVFIYYALASLVLALMMVLFATRKRPAVMSLAAHFGILILGVLIPVLEIALTAFIV